MEESALANSPFGWVPTALIPNILRFTDYKAQKAFSETCRPFNKWAHICSQTMYEQDRPSRKTQEEIFAVLGERLKARHPREFRQIDKKVMALSATISPENQRYVSIHSTLFARTFAQAVEENPGRFLQDGRPSQRVVDVFYWMPEKVVEAIDEELGSDEFQRSLMLIALKDSGRLAEYIAENREEFEMHYERHLLLTDDVALDPDSQSADSSDDLNNSRDADSSESETSHRYSDEALYNYVSKQVEDFRKNVLKIQKELPLLKAELTSKIPQITSTASGSVQLEEPKVNSGPSSPRHQ